MAREARLVIPGTAHHITQRGNRGKNVFFTTADRRYYLHLLAEHAAKHRLHIYAYCLMPDHVHLVIVPRDAESLTAALMPLHSQYAKHIRRTRKVRGSVWHGRFSSCPMDRRHTWEAVRYVERNPVRAGMILRPERYPWSSAAGHAGIRKDPLLWGNLEARGIVKNWTKWLRQGQDAAVVDLIRRSTRTGRPAGSAAFLARLEALSGRRLRPKKGGRPKKSDQPRKGGRPKKGGRPSKGGGKRRR